MFSVATLIHDALSAANYEAWRARGILAHRCDAEPEAMRKMAAHGIRAAIPDLPPGWLPPSPEHPEIWLTLEEIRRHTLVGAERRLRHLRDGNRDKVFAPQEPWDNDIESAGGELTLAKFVGVPWDGGVIGVFDEKDVDNKYQVRHSTNPSYSGLNIRADDADADLFVFSTGRSPVFRLWGWLLAGDAKHPQHVSDPGKMGKPLWIYPRARLNPMTSLPKL